MKLDAEQQQLIGFLRQQRDLTPDQKNFLDTIDPMGPPAPTSPEQQASPTGKDPGQIISENIHSDFDARVAAFQNQANHAGETVMNNLPAIMAGLGATATTVGIGLATKSPVLAVQSGTLAGGLFGALGEVARQKLAGEEPDFGKIRGETFFQAGAEGVGGTTVGIVQKLVETPGKGFLKFLGGKLLPKAAESRRILQEAIAKHEQYLLDKGFTQQAIDQAKNNAFRAAQISDGGVLDWADNFIKSSTVTGGPIREADQAVDQMITNIADAYASELGKRMSPDEAAQFIGQTLDASRARQLTDMSAMHEVVAHRLRTKTYKTPAMGVSVKPKQLHSVVETDGIAGLVDMSKIKKESAQVFRKFIESPFGKVAPDPEKLESILRNIENLPDKASFDEVKRWRSQLGEARSKSIGPNKNEQFSKASGELYSDLTDAMKQALDDYDNYFKKHNTGVSRLMHPSAREQWDNATEGSKWVYDHYDKQSINKFLDYFAQANKEGDNGRKLLQALVRPGGEQALRDIRLLVGEKSEGWQAMRTFMIDDLIERSTKKNIEGIPGQSTFFSAREFLDTVNSERKIGNNSTLNAIFNPKEVQSLVRQVEAMALHQSKNKVFGTSAARIGEDRIVLQAATGRLARAGKAVTAYALTLSGIRKLVMSPQLTRLLLDGTTLGWKSREGMAIVARLAGALGKDSFVPLEGDPPAETMSPMETMIHNTRRNQRRANRAVERGAQ